jgi:pSer/pThr/pTyr-binding forkhead associated (FHA) protein
MAASRLPPAQPGAPSVGQSGQGQGHAKDSAGVSVVPPPGQRQERRTRAYGPPSLPPPLRPVGGPITSAPPAPPPLPSAPPIPTGPPLSAVAHPTFADPGEEESEEQTTVDPEIFKAPRSLPREPARVQSGEADIDQKSTTTEAMSTESNDLLLEPSVDVAAELFEPYPTAPERSGPSRTPAGYEAPPPQPGQDDHLSSGTGEGGGTSVDEPTRDQGAFQPALHVARDLPAARPPARAPAPPEPELSPAWLVVQSGSDRGRRFALRGGRTTVGRGMDNDVVLTDIAVSRHHLTIEASAGQHILHDLGSGNGTLVNDRDEDDAFRLSHGDKLELGNTVLVFECTAAELPHALGKFHGPGDDEELSTVAGHRVAKAGPSAPTFAPAPPPVPAVAPHAPHPIAAQVTGPIDRIPASRRTLGPGQLGAIGAPPPPPPNLPPRARVGSTPSNPGPVRSRRSASMAVQQARRSASMAAQMPPGPGVQRSDSLSAMVSGAPVGPGAFPFGGPASTLGGMGAPGGAASGLRPALGYPPMSGGFGSMSPSPLSSPRFQYPNGVMSPLPATDRRRVLISILAIAFVAVGAGIVMALVHGGDKGTAPRTAAKAAAPPTDPAAPTAAPLPTATQTATATAPAADLLGARELRPVDFGTDEQFLAEATPAAARDTRPQGATVAVDAASAGPESGKSGGDERADGRADQDDGEQVAKVREPRREPRRRSRADDTDAIVEGAEPELPTLDDANAAVGTGNDAETALRQADGLYRQKRFSDAAAVLRKAADSAGKRDVGRLRSLAASYAKIGALLEEGQASLVSDAPRALQAFKSALRLDEESGDGVHDRTIGARIAQAAPAAAGAYMARKDYPEAKAAADIAEKFGAGDSDRVRIVRGSLERKAEELFEEARAAADAGDDAKAAETARLILRMVPRSSEVYAQANKLAAN